MAANEDQGSSRTITAAGPPAEGGQAAPHGSGAAGEVVQAEISPAEAPLAQLLQGASESIVVGADLAGLGGTTIIYVQPDGSLEGSGLTPEEQQSLLEQLSKQQLVQVSDVEAAQLLQHSPLVKSLPVHNTTLDPNQLQEVINQVTRSQQVQVVQQVQSRTVKQHKVVQMPQNKAPQLKAAQQVTIQTGSSVQLLQKKVPHDFPCLCGICVLR